MFPIKKDRSHQGKPIRCVNVCVCGLMQINVLVACRCCSSRFEYCLQQKKEKDAKLFVFWRIFIIMNFCFLSKRKRKIFAEDKKKRNENTGEDDSQPFKYYEIPPFECGPFFVTFHKKKGKNERTNLFLKKWKLAILGDGWLSVKSKRDNHRT